MLIKKLFILVIFIKYKNLDFIVFNSKIIQNHIKINTVVNGIKGITKDTSQNKISHVHINILTKIFVFFKET